MLCRRVFDPNVFGKFYSTHPTAVVLLHKAMRIAQYWILFLGKTIGDAMILSHLIPLFRRLVTSGIYEKTPLKILVFAALGVFIIQVCYWLDQHRFVTLRLGPQSISWSRNSLSIPTQFHIRWSRVFRSLLGAFQ
jgi:hypothetical protein